MRAGKRDRMVMYSIVYTKNAIVDIPKLKSAGLDKKAKMFIDILRKSLYQTPPTFEKLQGDLQGAFSRRINIKHRLVYAVYEDKRVVKIISLRAHY